MQPLSTLKRWRQCRGSWRGWWWCWCWWYGEGDADGDVVANGGGMRMLMGLGSGNRVSSLLSARLVSLRWPKLQCRRRWQVACESVLVRHAPFGQHAEALVLLWVWVLYLLYLLLLVQVVVAFALAAGMDAVVVVHRQLLKHVADSKFLHVLRLSDNLICLSSSNLNEFAFRLCCLLLASMSIHLLICSTHPDARLAAFNYFDLQFI